MSVTKETDLTIEQWHGLLELAAALKREKRADAEAQRLQRRNIALVFGKNSTRTRCAFEVAAHDQGAHVTYLDPTGSQLGHKESVKDTGRVLGRMFDGIEYRGFAQASVAPFRRLHLINSPHVGGLGGSAGRRRVGSFRLRRPSPTLRRCRPRRAGHACSSDEHRLGSLESRDWIMEL